MRFVIRYFFKTLRLVITPFMLAIHWLTLPKGVERSPEEQQQVDKATDNLTLYQFNTCPFCLKVRREIRRLSLNIPLRDAQHDPEARHELKTEGGQLKVPCLRIDNSDGSVNWLYESDDIIDYLHQRVATVE